MQNLEIKKTNWARLHVIVIAFLLLVNWNCKPRALDSKTVQPPNVIFMIGDGMGLAQISMAIEHAQDNLAFSKCKHMGFIKTKSIDDYITDSAAGATAFATGHKTQNTRISTDTNGRELPTLFEMAIKRDWLTALVVTSSITHATPACFYAHEDSRYSNLAIAQDFLGSNVNFAIGAGKPYFDSLPDFNIPFAVGFDNFNKMKQNRWMGFYNNDSTSVDPVLKGGEGFLPKSTGLILDLLSEKKKSFMLMIEGSQIDWGGHDNDSEYVISELLDFNKTIEVVLAYLEKNPNTLVVVTADHETGGLALLDDENNQMVPHFSTKHHSGIMVPVFAFGKGANQFSGIYDNTEIFNKLSKAMGL